MGSFERGRGTTAMRAAFALVSSATVTMACSAPLQPPSADPCHCASGYVCCDSGMCAPDRASCTPTTVPPIGPPFELFADVAGTWEGILDTFTFASGSDAIVIEISAPAGGTASAHVVFGDGPAPPPPALRDVAWPAPDVIPLMAGLEGYRYVARDLRRDGLRVAFTLSRWSPWQDWCSLQAPVANPILGYACVAAPAMRDSSGNAVLDAQGRCQEQTTPPIAVDCAVAFPLCMGTPPICTCDARSCRATDLPAILFDLSLDQQVGEGITNLPDYTNGTALVHLRQTAH